MIIQISRGFLRVNLANKIAHIEGELCFPPTENFEFIVYVNSIKNWEEPFDKIEITEEEKEQLINDIKNEFRQKRGKVVFD